MVNQLVAAEGVALPKHEKLQLRLFKVQPCKITTNKFPDSLSASDEALKKTSKLHPLLSLYIFSCVLFLFFIFSSVFLICLLECDYSWLKFSIRGMAFICTCEETFYCISHQLFYLE